MKNKAIKSKRSSMKYVGIKLNTYGSLQYLMGAVDS